MRGYDFLKLTQPFVTDANDVDDVQAWIDAVIMINGYVLKEFDRMVFGRSVEA